MIVMPTTLATQRLRLRAPLATDAPAVLAYASDPEATRFMEWRTHVDEVDTLDFIEAVQEGWEDGDDYCYLLTLAASDEIVGAASVQFDEHGAALGYIVAPEYWRQGLASEAAKALLDAAWQTEDVYRVWATVDIDNTASARVLEKIGMQREARLARWSSRPNLPDQHIPRDVYVYAVIR